MKSKNNFKMHFSNGIYSVILLAVGFCVVIPFIWMLSASFKIQADIHKFPVEWIPGNITFNNFKEVWTSQDIGFLTFYLNSIKISVICVAGEIFTSSLAAYAFSRIVFKGRDKLFLLYLATMMIPYQVLLVPRFIIFRWLGIYDTHWALILPGIFTTLGVFLLRQFFISVPQELSQSAKIDGANEFRVYWQIILPLAKPALASLGILSFVWRWNDYTNPLIFISKKSLYTIPLGLTIFVDEMGGQEDGLIMAATVSALLPIIIIFLSGQKYFIEGVIAGSIKG